MHETMRRRQSGRMAYYTCDRLPVRHAFTTKSGGVSTGDCESLNFGFNRPSRCIGTRSSLWRSIMPAPV